MSAHPDLSRRAFFATLPAVTAGLTVPAMAAETAGPHWSMLVDTRRCIACQACTMACAMENASPEGQFRTVVATYAVTGQDGKTGLSVLPRLCNHCDQPPCIPVCPVGATFKREDGIVVVDGDRCVGCAYCVQACPYDARFINHDTGKADKCTFCSHRLEAGLLPACVETCVGGARIFGDTNDPHSDISQQLKMAEGHIQVLKPEAKTSPRVFYIGLDDHLKGRVDGTSAADMMWRPNQQGA
ncbi:sulfate reduction electron transfer complex DsrMKJOP subunit DsrO [Rhodoferax sp.]|uniref:sulfate reduction electron transfer complex DsrMKJOP subunit DsrO n=1 Tax=Rhodoferax sp. TaxID=50421 RepID=UPI002731C4A6|nr:4Fe-4S dicluster domain-containing protein [Rhodoferax sp.]MDP1530347.1 4Fe-4S dicluster domain-containing protein [Rhodoferax sp.]MDP1943307.1 4Fe-4S dicluster domain-containing protein [Rhodoferax sp.]MDP2442649.1 4Fe-4S dicluster domain-containing protein [Rhodoferax sp.]MDP3864351.1 4Fe-4S dicluster domain-containing protein [Rhodoferax sp.]MDZ4209062.1 4Fe-4S dicluster domain-containing protein [Rhodoferax sp.]